MTSFGRPDATGRSSGKRTGRQRVVHLPPKGQGWIWLTEELLASDAWREMSHDGSRVIFRLLLDHLSHAGTENGALVATYDQLQAFGLRRGNISEALKEVEFLGLVRRERGGLVGPSRYRLTFYSDRDGRPATNEWKATRREAVKAWRVQRKDVRLSKNTRKPRYPNVEPRGYPLVVLDRGKPSEAE